jgi:hypothetical protein
MPQSWLQQQSSTGHNRAVHNPHGNRSHNYGSSSNSGTDVLSMLLLICILVAAGYYGYKYWKGDFKNPAQKTEKAVDSLLEAKVKEACATAKAKVLKEAADKEKLEKNGTCSNDTLKTKSKCESSFFCSDSTKLTKDTCEAITDATWSPRVWSPLITVNETEIPANESFISTNTPNPDDPLDEKYMSYTDFM